ncbi:MAG: hypothetical protein KatS3mg092_0033 [Patescibacteria group bacterium]|nr:MAG: hypothetical protein KatS3mg092_0033 [Patescibacteria group bacterium]
MESKTYIKNVIISPKKLRFYLKDIKKLTPVEALERLFYGQQKATKILYQAIKSAINNAKQTLKIDENLLKFKVLTVEEGLRLKRYRAGSRGTAKPILKRRSHIKIILEGQQIPAKKVETKVEERNLDKKNEVKNLKVVKKQVKKTKK